MRFGRAATINRTTHPTFNPADYSRSKARRRKYSRENNDYGNNSNRNVNVIHGKIEFPIIPLLYPSLPIFTHMIFIFFLVNSSHIQKSSFRNLYDHRVQLAQPVGWEPRLGVARLLLGRH